MALSHESIQALEGAILEGTFPESEDFLTATLSLQSIPSLLGTISKAKDDLSMEIQEISKEKAEDVDIWIKQAKKVQEDIARCKLEARQIVEDHERVQALRKTVKDADDKVQLLENEIAFSQSIQSELESIAEISQVLEEAHGNLAAGQPVGCVEKLVSTEASISRIPRGPSRGLLEQMDEDLRQRARSQLGEALDETWIATREENNARIELVTDKSLQAMTVYKISTETALHALAQLDSLDEGSRLILTKLERLLLPLLSKKLSLYPSSINAAKEKMHLELGSSLPTIANLLTIMRELLTFLHLSLPQSIKNEIAELLVPQLVSSLIVNWLNHAIPYGLSDLSMLQTLQTEVTRFETLLSSFSWPGSQELKDWIDQIPRTWLNKRRMVSLDAVRTAFSAAAGNTRQVERIERQVVMGNQSVEEEQPVSTVEEDDWNAAWDEEPTSEDSKAQEGKEEEEEPEGWDFDTETEGSHTDPQNRTTPSQGEDDDDDEGDAWGWGDESPGEEKIPNISKTASKPANGEKTPSSAKEEIVLKESYSVTDIPDHILEVVGRDISDSQTLKMSTNNSFFDSSAPTSALRALPTLVLAMFRATAAMQYSHSRKLSNMNLYNDALYINQKITEISSPETKPTLQPAIDAMAKFARQTYTRELDTQRTILADLLDGAQGFVSCNSDQYRELSANAVSAVVDRIRQVHQEYRDILGQSHLLQTIGSLIAMIVGKVISDIEDLEDISEKESDRLVEYCQQILSLEDLFMATRPQGLAVPGSNSKHDEEPQQISTIALYVPNYFRFQYLAEVLKSSLADIKFMWIEGGLQTDFSADEVIDLVRALFAESNHRRSAISAIRGHA